MAERYNFDQIEPKWQQYWREKGLFSTRQREDRPAGPCSTPPDGEPAKTGKFYYLEMFPYPSGDLHMGHVRNYTIGDTMTRYLVMNGHNVLHPMGWDAFGLPAENAAIERQIHPDKWMKMCTEKMKVQFDQLGFSYDWGREINTSQPDYYKWTQWLFLKLYHAGLAYRGQAMVNWCPSCQTVLANEELDGAYCERCGTMVAPKPVGGQWFFKITDYAERLLDDIALLTEWPERVRVMQENWIGRSTGVSFRFELEYGNDARGAGVSPADGGRDARLTRDIATRGVEVFTTRIDTIYGVTYMVLAPEHPLASALTEGTEYEAPVRRFVAEAVAEGIAARGAADTEKKGIFTGAYAIHPLTGEKVPIWVANYVLMEYGTGAVMAVPAHDQRDLEFARKYGLAVKVVIKPSSGDDTSAPPADDPRGAGVPPAIGGRDARPTRQEARPAWLDADTMTEAYTAPGVQVNSAEFDGMISTEAKEAIATRLEEMGVGRKTVHYRLRDWLVSRQRYWGCPIPIVTCEACGEVAVPEEQLPVLLPEDAEFKPTGESPLAINEAFVNTTCPKCGGPAKRETDTMTTFVCSSWYYLRFCSPHADDVPFRREEADYWLPVDKYVGGIEHAVRHLLYSRFITKVLNDLGHISFREPFGNLFTQGMIYKDGAKMSKSKGNVVPPDAIINSYGADTGRVFILFVGPPEQDAEWSDRGVEGCHRFLRRVWNAVADNVDAYDPGWREHIPAEMTDAQRVLRRKTHQTILAVSHDIENMRFNTAVSAIMELANVLVPFVQGIRPRGSDETRGAGVSPADGGRDARPTAGQDARPTGVSLADRAIFSEAAESALLVLSPMAPHLCDELWERLGLPPSIYEQPWPTADAELAKEDVIVIPVQVNGKVRGKVEVPAGTDMATVQELGLALESVRKFMEGKEIVKIIPVPGKLLNVVVK